MPRILALDVGEKTIGVAVSDETETFAFPDKTLQRQEEGYRKDMAAVRDLVENRGIHEIVVGMPLMLDGSRGIQAEKVASFIDALRRYVRVPIHVQDERLSTAEVERILIAADRRRQQRKQVVDSMAASVILQRFLDTRNRAATSHVLQEAPPELGPGGAE